MGSLFHVIICYLFHENNLFFLLKCELINAIVIHGRFLMCTKQIELFWEFWVLRFTFTSQWRPFYQLNRKGGYLLFIFIWLLIEWIKWDKKNKFTLHVNPSCENNEGCCKTMIQGEGCHLQSHAASQCTEGMTSTKWSPIVQHDYQDVMSRPNGLIADSPHTCS